MDLQLQDRTVLVTGAAGGIGLACVQRFLEEGARVVASDLNADRAGSAVAELVDTNPAWPKRTTFIAADMREEQSILDMVEKAVATFGPIHVLVNNAAITHRAEFLDMAFEDFDRVVATNLRGPFVLGQAIARQLVEHGDVGSIVNVGSVNAQLALPDNAAYVASKGGLLQLTRSMAVALAAQGIRVNMVAPGSIDTPLQRAGQSRSPDLRKRVLSRTPLGRLGNPAEVADAIVYVASPRASYITGECLFVDGGRLPLNFTVPVDDAALEPRDDQSRS
jgi:NAD(P)-dependent dehydrogenase (short-subunit alcohol dehydrogenase family)